MISKKNKRKTFRICLACGLLCIAALINTATLGSKNQRINSPIVKPKMVNLVFIGYFTI